MLTFFAGTFFNLHFCLAGPFLVRPFFVDTARILMHPQFLVLVKLVCSFFRSQASKAAAFPHIMAQHFHAQVSHTQLLSNTILSHTVLSHATLATHTTLAAHNIVTHNSFARNFPHTTLSGTAHSQTTLIATYNSCTHSQTLSDTTLHRQHRHTQLFHTQLCHAQLFHRQHCHTQLFHKQHCHTRRFGTHLLRTAIANSVVECIGRATTLQIFLIRGGEHIGLTRHEDPA